MTDHGGAASPRTEAGRTFLDLLLTQDRLLQLHVPVDWAHGIRAIEAEAAQEAPAPEGLRDALDSLDRKASEHRARAERDEGDHWWANGYTAATKDIRRDLAFLSTPPTPAEPPRPCPDCGPYTPCPKHDDVGRAEARPPEGLDADRLARALDKIEKGIATRYPGATYPSQQKAAAIAAEYARLSAGGAE